MSENTSVSSRSPVVRYALYGGLFVFALGIAYFVGPVTFYFSFQKELESVASQVPGQSVIQVRPETLNVAHAESVEPASARGGWRRVVDGDVGFYLPPGQIKQLEKQGETLVVKYESGEVLVDRMPAGFLKQTYLKLLEHLNADPQKLPRELAEMRDDHFLDQVSAAVLDDYRFGFDETQRIVYSANIMTKMLLWEMETIAPFLLLKAEDRQGVFFLKNEESAKVTVSCPQGFFVYSTVGIPLGSPSVEDPWLDFHSVSIEQRRAWAQDIMDRTDLDDPLRTWAESQIPADD